MADRAEKRGLSKPAEAAKEDNKAAEATTAAAPEKIPGNPSKDYNPDDIKELMADIATRHTAERNQNYARHDKERSEMNKRHEKDFKDLNSRHTEEIASTNPAPKMEGE